MKLGIDKFDVPAVDDPMFCHSTHVYEPDSKPFQHNDNTLVDAGLKEGNKILKEEQNGNLFGLKGCEKETDPLSFELNDGDRLWKTPDIHCYISVDSLRNGNKNEVRDSIAPYSNSSSKTELYEDTDFYTDKSVMECELPELIVCYKESYNSVVKDICVDEGVPSMDKILVENGKDEPVGLCTSFSHDKDNNFELTKDKVDIGFPVLDELKALEENSCNNDTFNHSDTEDSENSDFTNEKENLELSDLGELKSFEVNACNNDTSNQSDSEDAENIDLAKQREYNELPGPDELISSVENAVGNQSCETIDDAKDETESDVLKGKVVRENRLQEQDWGIENSLCKSSEIDGNEVEQQSIQMPKGDTISVKLISDFSVEESNNSSIIDELSYNSKVENGSITFHFDSSTPVASGETEGPQNVDIEPPLETPNALRHEDDDTSDHLKVGSQVDTEGPQNVGIEQTPIAFSHEDDDTSDHLKVSSQVETEEPQNVDIEPPLETLNAFSHEDDDTSDHLKVSSQIERDHGESSFTTFSGLITISGPIAYSGSLSHRSDSSATSTRSFAFPILQTEWNSSPVRMAKADRRRFRKHRGWRQGLLCCRF